MRRFCGLHVPLGDHAVQKKCCAFVSFSSCAASSMPCPGMYAAAPYRLPSRPVEGLAVGAHLICIGCLFGALLACGRCSSLRGGFSPSAATLSPFCAAHARPCALTLCTSGVVLLCGRAPPATLLTVGGSQRGAPFPPHLWAPLRSAHVLASRAKCGLRYAPPTHTQAAVHGVSDGRTSRTRLRCSLRATQTPVYASGDS